MIDSDNLQDIERALNKIANNLHRMHLLAELSASDLTVDRDALQKTMDHLKDNIDHITDEMEKLL